MHRDVFLGSIEKFYSHLLNVVDEEDLCFIGDVLYRRWDNDDHITYTEGEDDLLEE